MTFFKCGAPSVQPDPLSDGPIVEISGLEKRGGFYPELRAAREALR